jgi:ribonuclease E
VRSVSSVALQLLRAIEEMLLKGATHNLVVRTRTETALYLLNHKRAHLRELEERFQLLITVNADATVAGQVSYVIEKGEQVHSLEQAKALVAVQPTSVAPVVDDEDDEPVEELDALEQDGNLEEAAGEDRDAGSVLAPEATQSEGGRKRRRRRRGRRGGEGREGEAPAHENGAGNNMAAPSEDDRMPDAGGGAAAETEPGGPEATGESQADGEKRRRRRGRRGGRRSRHGREGEALPQGSDPAPSFQAEASVLEPREESHQEESARREPEQGDSYPRDFAESSAAQRQAEVAHDRDQDAPVAEPVAPIPPVSGPTAPRRGSTVREPAPTSFAFGGEISTPVPAPHVEPEQPSGGTETEDIARPRRAGWWSKRVLGKG